jgi:polyisoprenoid-binding protein YceI
LACSFCQVSWEPGRQGFDYAFGFLDHRHAHRQFTDHLWRNGSRVAIDIDRDYVNDLFTKEAAAFVERDDQRPFFVYLNYTVPHAELRAPDEAVGSFRGRFPEQPFENPTADEKPTGASPELPSLGYRDTVAGLKGGIRIIRTGAFAIPMIQRLRSLVVGFMLVAIVSLATTGAATAAGRPIDAEHSTLTVLVFKAGLFSAFADDHVISAPIAGGSISDDAPLAVEIKVRSADLKVLDPNLSASKRDEVQTRMVGPEVLDVMNFPDITFTSTAVDAAGPNRWQVTGRLTIHGQTQTVRFPVVLQTGKYRGDAVIKQRDFGITPIRIAGGAVRVKDEVTVRFEIAK